MNLFDNIEFCNQTMDWLKRVHHFDVASTYRCRRIFMSRFGWHLLLPVANDNEPLENWWRGA